MTDRIDLDERIDDEPDDEDGHPDDWIWRDDAAPTEAAESSLESASESKVSGNADTAAESDTAVDSDTAVVSDTTVESDTGSDVESSPSIPHVPHPNKGKPAGIPVEGGGSGGGTKASGANTAAGASDGESTEIDPDDVAASGPHGGGADEMTMAFTFAAIQRVTNPAAVLADAGGWSDWIGIVGDVDAHVINKFQRDHTLDVDFFNGTGTGPGERLAEIGPHSMFYADRMVVVGLGGRDEQYAAEADWEFVPLETAAEKAGWKLVDD